MSKPPQDRRTRQTRGAIVGSFNQLILSRPAERIQVGDIIAEAGVGRSTFYEHFRNTDELLAHSAAWLLDILADAATDAGDVYRIRCVLDHIRQNHQAARAMLAPEAVLPLVRALADRIQPRVTDICRDRSCSTIIPASMAATHLAEGQFTLIRTWLDTAAPCPSTALAAAIRQTTQSALQSLLAPLPS
jgi:AcrR family transcriptional regulator